MAIDGAQPQEQAFGLGVSLQELYIERDLEGEANEIALRVLDEGYQLWDAMQALVPVTAGSRLDHWRHREVLARYPARYDPEKKESSNRQQVIATGGRLVAGHDVAVVYVQPVELGAKDGNESLWRTIGERIMMARTGVSEVHIRVDGRLVPISILPHIIDPPLVLERVQRIHSTVKRIADENSKGRRHRGKTPYVNPKI